MNQEKPWVNHYDLGVKAHLDYPHLCLHDVLSNQAHQLPDHIAIIENLRKITYQDLNQRTINFSMHLVHMGLKKGDRVGICLPNSIEFAIAYFGILRAGGIVVALNPLFPIRELETQIKKTVIRFVIVLAKRLPEFKNLMSVSSIEKIIVVDENSRTEEIHARGEKENFLTSFDFLTTHSDQVVDLPALLPSTPAVFQFSGGTTGTPKAAVCSHQNIVSNVTQFRHWLVNLEEGKETFLVAIPLYHVYGMVLGLNLGVAMGARMVFLSDPRNISEMLKVIQEYQVGYFPGVPSTFNMIIQHPEVKAGKYDLRMIKACISGSAPLPESVRIQFEELTGGRLVEGYGLSEAPTATHCNPIMGEKRKGSIGLPLPDVDCMVASMDGNEVGVNIGEPGELLIRAPQVMMGYFYDEKETALVLKNRWLHTGDIVRMDEDGYFYIIGRKKELIKVHGLQVWPAEVENVILKHPAVKECVVAGVPDMDSGERVKAWIIPNTPETEVSIEDLQKFCRNELAGYKLPREVEICESIPRSPVGKYLRRELVRMHMEKNQ